MAKTNTLNGGSEGVSRRGFLRNGLVGLVGAAVAPLALAKRSGVSPYGLSGKFVDIRAMNRFTGVVDRVKFEIPLGYLKTQSGFDFPVKTSEGRFDYTAGLNPGDEFIGQLTDYACGELFMPDGYERPALSGLVDPAMNGGKVISGKEPSFARPIGTSALIANTAYGGLQTDEAKVQRIVDLAYGLPYLPDGEHTIVRTPLNTLLRGGDCEDKARLAAVMVASQGLPCALIHMVGEGREKGHVALAVTGDFDAEPVAYHEGVPFFYAETSGNLGNGPGEIQLHSSKLIGHVTGEYASRVNSAYLDFV